MSPPGPSSSKCQTGSQAAPSVHLIGDPFVLIRNFEKVPSKVIFHEDAGNVAAPGCVLAKVFSVCLPAAHSSTAAKDPIVECGPHLRR